MLWLRTIHFVSTKFGFDRIWTDRHEMLTAYRLTPTGSCSVANPELARKFKVQDFDLD